MTSGRPPRRWAESGAEIPSALRDWLDHERSDAPSDDQLRDLAARISATLNADPNVVPEGGGVSSAGTTSLKRIARVGTAVMAIGVTIALGGVFYRTLDRPRSSAVASAGERLSPVVIAAPVPSTKPPSPSTPAPDLAPPAEQGPRMAANRPRPAPVRPAHGGVQAPLSSDPEAELELLRRARGQLAATPQRALDTTDEHQVQFRNGVFAQEREAIAIEALVRLGKQPQARQRAKAFHSRYPNSAYARRLETIAPLP